MSFNMTERPHESHGAVLDPQMLSCSDSPRNLSRTSIAEFPAGTISPQNRHVMRRRGQFEAWCCTCQNERIHEMLLPIHYSIKEFNLAD